jgi:hypothetical protein
MDRAAGGVSTLLWAICSKEAPKVTQVLKISISEPSSEIRKTKFHIILTQLTLQSTNEKFVGSSEI